MRIALVSPYSWTYPGGVTRHIEALAAELRAMGHDARIIAPYDPDDRLARATHGGARPQRRPAPDHLVALGRTVGISANGAVSNIAFSPESILALRRELRDGYDVAHIHEPIAPMISTEALTAGPLPLVGTFHCHSENPLTNNFANALGARRKFNRLHVRIAVSDAAAWTARRFFGGHYRIIPNGVETGRGPAAQLDGPAQVDCGRARGGPLRILFVGQAVERKGLPVLLRAFEALRDQVPATLTLVGAGAEEIAPLLLDDAGVRALGKLSEARKLEELGRADLLCAPSLGGESFGMVLTEAFAGGTPVVASDIAGYRDVVRDGVDGLLVAPGDPLALAEALRELALDPARRARMAGSARAQAEQFAWPRVAAQVLGAYEDAIAVPQPAGRVARAAVRYGLSPADLKPRVPARPQPPLDRSEAPPRRRRRRRAAHIAGQVLRVGVSLTALAVAYLALQRV
ncbi:MAG: glycosyltransferase family 4 protein, partial [Solirubrobacterales bacterium]|nr:glycosyltransferase family 4 protein [Solirubrobacterales bacterium]